MIGNSGEGRKGLRMEKDIPTQFNLLIITNPTTSSHPLLSRPNRILTLLVLLYHVLPRAQLENLYVYT